MRRSTIVVVSAEGAADKLDVNLTTMYRWLHSNQLAAVKKGKRWQVFLIKIDQPNEDPAYLTIPYKSLPSLVGEEIATAIGG